MATNAAARMIVLLREKFYRVNLPVIAEDIDATMHLPPLFDAIRGVMKAAEDAVDIGYANRLIGRIDDLRAAFKATEGE